MTLSSGPNDGECRGERSLAAVVALIWMVAYLLLFYATGTRSGVVRAAAVWGMVVEAAAPFPARPFDAPLGLEAFAQRLWLASIALGFVLSAIGWGSLVLRALRATERLASLEQVLFSYAAGTALLSLSTLSAGMAGLMHRPVHLVLVVAGPAAAGVMRLRQGWQVRQRRAAVRTPAARAAVWLVPALLPLALLGSAAMLPPDVGHRYFDVKEYHLQAPKEYFLDGRIAFLPHNVYASMPLGTEMLSLLAMIVTGDWWWGALAGQTLLAAFAPATAGLLYLAGRRFFGAPAGAIAALLYLSMPAVFEVSTTAYVEGGLSFYLLAAMYAFSIARSDSRTGGAGADQGDDRRGASLAFRKAATDAVARSGSPAAGDAEEEVTRAAASTSGKTRAGWKRNGIRTSARLFFLSGLFAGAAAACKYPAAAYVLLPLSIASAIPARRRQASISVAYATATFLAGALLTFGPWLARNVIDTGNPVYPLMWDLLGGRGWSAEQDARWWQAHGPRGFTWEGLLGGVWQVGIGDSARSPLNSLLFAWAPVALTEPLSRKRAARLGAYALLILAVWWGATHRIDRFWYPVIPVVALLAGAGGAWMARNISGKAVAALVLVSMLGSAAQSVTGHPSWRLYGWRLFTLELRQAREMFTKPPVAYINRELPRDAVVLAVGEAAVFDIRREVFYSTAFNARMFDHWLADESGLEIARLGITHVYVDWAEIARYRSAGNYGFTDTVVPELFEDLVRRGVLGRPIEFDQAGRLLGRRAAGDAPAAFYALYPVRNPRGVPPTRNRSADHRR